MGIKLSIESKISYDLPKIIFQMEISFFAILGYIILLLIITDTLTRKERGL